MNTPRTRLKHIRQSVRLVWTSAPGWTVLQGLLVLVQGVLPVATLFLTRQVVDAASAFLGQAPGAREPWSLLALAPWVAAVAVAGWLCRAFSSLVVAAQVEVVADTVQDALQAKSVDVDLAYYETSSYHDQMRLAQAEATGRATSIVRNLVQLGSGSIMLVSVASVLAGTQGLLLPLLLLAAVPGALARLYNARRWNRWRMQQNTTSRYAGYLHVLLTSLPFAKEIRLFGLADELRGQSRRLRDRLRHSRLILLRRRAAAEIATMRSRRGCWWRAWVWSMRVCRRAVPRWAIWLCSMADFKRDGGPLRGSWADWPRSMKTRCSLPTFIALWSYPDESSRRAPPGPFRNP
ncbi:MAG: hypothetical protein RBT03_07425 [Kiritimatiellia bacterium]|jgi:ATP-binding cassette subfamily B protein|nr:hypothetical protein [Kiritimatiellia bacterium]